MKLRPKPSSGNMPATTVTSSRKSKAGVQKPRSRKANSTQASHLKKDALASRAVSVKDQSNMKSSKRASSTTFHDKADPIAFSSLERLPVAEGNESGNRPGLPSSNPSKKRRISFADSVESSEIPSKPQSKPRSRPTRPSARSSRVEEKQEKTSVSQLNDSSSTRRRGREAAYRECNICATNKPLGRNGSNFPKFEQCNHEPLTCTDCVAKHVTVTLESRKPVVPEDEEDTSKIATAVWSLCSCPQCGVSLTEEALFPALSRADMSRISALVAVKARKEGPRWFSCISPTCNSGQIHPVIIKDGVEVQKVTCVACGFEGCFYHRLPWHEGYTCGQYDDNHPSAKSSQSSVRKIKQMTKKCPTAGCGWRVEKAGGCDHIYCECYISPPPQHFTFPVSVHTRDAIEISIAP